MHFQQINRGLGVIVTLCGIVAGSANLASAAGPEPTALWPDGAPGAVGDEDADRPQLRAYLPSKVKATGAGIVVCPGGGYGILAMDHEGHHVARWLNSIGVAGFVLKYRLAPRYRHPAPLQDAQRAIRWVRANATKLGVAENRIGVMGFSAGGHLASTAATHFDSGDATASDPIDRAGCRPDFSVLCYPVISMTQSFGHAGSKRNLLGESPEPGLAESLSNELQVTAETPPTFLFHTGDDTGVPVENSLAFYAALRKAGVPGELHVYQVGPHGVGLADADPAVGGWKDRLAQWLQSSGFLTDARRAAVRGTVTVDGQPLARGMIAIVPAMENQPRAWAMVANGAYRIGMDRGPVIGPNSVEVYDFGAIQSQPTLEEVRRWTVEEAQVTEGETILDVGLPASEAEGM